MPHLEGQRQASIQEQRVWSEDRDEIKIDDSKTEKVYLTQWPPLFSLPYFNSFLNMLFLLFWFHSDIVLR